MQALARRDPGVVVVGGSAEALPIRSAAVRAVWVSQVLHHVTDLSAAAAGLRRVLVPGGRVLVRGMYRDLAGQWPLVSFFPGILKVEVERFPPWSRIQDHLEGAGLRLTAWDRVEQTLAGGMAELDARTCHRADSGLALLPDEQFHEGLARMRALAEAEGVPTPVSETLDFVVFASEA
ncbi:MAG TPA: methyltransferase domain-containing protein [Mycobacteriales bacterium]|nr:methyltransferase domain-containing protein [Mycobacteriales bacterium]